MTPEEPSPEPIPVHPILDLLRVGSAREIAEALRSRDRPRLARLLRDRELGRLIGFAGAGDLDALAKAILTVDTGRRAGLVMIGVARQLETAFRVAVEEANPPRAVQRRLDALRARTPRRIARNLKGADIEALTASLRACDRARVARLLAPAVKIDPSAEPLNDAEAIQIVEAIPQPDTFFDEVAASLRADATEHRALEALAWTFRGRVPGHVLALVQAGVVSSLLDAMREQAGDPRMTREDAGVLLDGLRQLDREAIARLIRQLQEQAALLAPKDLTNAELDEFLASLAGCDLEELSRRLGEQQHRQWEQTFALVLPGLAKRVRAFLRLTSRNPVATEQVDSVVNAVVKSFLSDVRAGRLVSSELNTTEDLTLYLLRIAYNKARRRLRCRYGVRVVPLDVDGDGSFESPDGVNGVTETLIGIQLERWFDNELDVLKRRLDPVDQIILDERLGDATYAEIAQRVERETGRRCSEERVGWRWRIKIRGPLLRSLGPARS